jgi:hypothetical protein
MNAQSTDRSKYITLLLKVLSAAVIVFVLYWIVDFVWGITRLVGW